MDHIDRLGRGGWSAGSLGNYNMIDREGNIGYTTLATLPIRKDQTPYIG